MKVLLKGLAILILLGFIIKFPLFFIGTAIAIWGVYLLKKQKRQNHKTKLAPAFLIIGLVLALTGCVDGMDEENAQQEAPATIKEVTQKEDDQTENKVQKENKEEVFKTETVQEEEEKKQETKVTVTPPITSSEQKNSSATKPAPSKKVDTSGTTAQVPVKLVKTIDGDTIKVLYNGQEINVRYLLIDTPETNHPRLGKQPFGEEAKEMNRQLVNSGKLTVEFDIGERYDKYDRLLAYVYVDGKSVQKSLLAAGLARVAYVYPPNTRQLTPFEESQEVAKKKGIGIWSVDNYATDSGFVSSAVPEKKPASPPAASKPTTTPAPKKPVANTGGSEWFQNCTELRKKYPQGVAQGHPAYQSKMDRDKDGFACER